MARKFLTGIDAGSQKITSVADPTSAQDAATLASVGVAARGGYPGKFLPDPHIGQSTGAFVADRVYLCRWRPPSDMTIVRFGICVSVAAGTDDTISVGYAAGTTGVVIAASSSTGIVNGTGWKYVTGLSWALTGGTDYLFAFARGTVGSTVGSFSADSCSNAGGGQAAPFGAGYEFRGYMGSNNSLTAGETLTINAAIASVPSMALCTT